MLCITRVPYKSETLPHLLTGSSCMLWSDYLALSIGPRVCKMNRHQVPETVNFVPLGFRLSDLTRILPVLLLGNFFAFSDQIHSFLVYTRFGYVPLAVLSSTTGLETLAS
jgi:hypothetical protein